MFPMLRLTAPMILIEDKMYDSIFLRDPPTKAAVTVVDLLFSGHYPLVQPQCEVRLRAGGTVTQWNPCYFMLL